MFECLSQNNITEKQSTNSISESSSELDVLYLFYILEGLKEAEK